MAKTVRDVMTRNPVAMSAESSVVDAAKAMSDMRIGSVVVMDRDNKPCGIVTDRDITVHAVATGSDPAQTKLVDICSKELAAVKPEQSVDDAMEMMKAHDVKRVLVIGDSKLEGILSLGDLAREGDTGGVQEDISKAEPNSGRRP